MRIGIRQQHLRDGPGAGLQPRHLDVPAALRGAALRFRAAADGGAAGGFGDHALFPADLAVQVNDVVGYDTWLGVAMAHAVMIAPFAVVLILVALAQVDRRIDLAARGFGASRWQRATRSSCPNIKFGVLTAALLSFVLSWEEIGVTLFITSVNAVTLPRLMWMGLRDNIDPAIAAISVILILVTAAVIMLRQVAPLLLRKGSAG